MTRKIRRYTAEFKSKIVIETLKADKTTKHIPIIFLTGMTGSKDVEKGFKTGANDYVPKPFCPTELRARIHNQL